MEQTKKKVEEASSFFLDEENLGLLFDFIGMAVDVAATVLTCIAEASDS